MRASQGIPSGRKIMLYYPELFNEYEEVIIYPQKEFKVNFLAIKDQIEYCFLKNSLFEMDEEWKLLGYWLSIMERVHMMEIDLNQFFSAKASQSYLDSYIYETAADEKMAKVGLGQLVRDNVKLHESEVLESANGVSNNPLGIDWL